MPSCMGYVQLLPGTKPQRALALAETAYGPEHPTVGTTPNTLAVMLSDLGELAAARPLADLERPLSPNMRRFSSFPQADP